MTFQCKQTNWPVPIYSTWTFPCSTLCCHGKCPTIGFPLNSQYPLVPPHSTVSVVTVLNYLLSVSSQSTNIVLRSDMEPRNFAMSSGCQFVCFKWLGCQMAKYLTCSLVTPLWWRFTPNRSGHYVELDRENLRYMCWGNISIYLSTTNLGIPRYSLKDISLREFEAVKGLNYLLGQTLFQQSIWQWIW